MRYFLLILVVAMGQSVFTAEKIPSDTQNLKKGKAFTLAVLPDTQFYCDTRLKLSKKWGNGDLRRYFFEQTRWVRDNQKRLNIAFLVHEGDIVQADFPEEWAIAKKAMSILDGKVPYCMCLGNHDMGFKKSDNKYGGDIAVNRTTLFNKYFPREKFAKRKEFGGTFDPDRHDNSWYHFEAAGMKFLIVSLECKPRDEVLTWANKVVAKHRDHRVIVLTHAYMRANGHRIDKLGYKIKGNAGEEMWQKLVSKHKNIFMVLCGHSAGEAVLTSKGDHGNQVHQVLSDYQHLNNGGESWLRYMVFEPNENKIKVYTYNPALDKFRNNPSSRFDLDYPMAQPPVTAPGITRPGAANDVNEATKLRATHEVSGDKMELRGGLWYVKGQAKPFSGKVSRRIPAHGNEIARFLITTYVNGKKQDSKVDILIGKQAPRPNR